MKRLTMPFLLALLSFSVAVPGCATTPPIIHNIETCAGKNVNAADVSEAVADLETQNFADLTLLAFRVGWPTIVCIIDAETANKPGLKPAGEQFKRQHAVEIRGSVSLRSRGEEGPIEMPLAARPASDARDLSDYLDPRPVPILLVESDWKTPMECDGGMYNAIVVLPGAVCIRDGQTWHDVLLKVREQGLAGRITGGGPLEDSISEMAGRADWTTL